MRKIVDSHCHLDYEGLAEDLPAMLQRCDDAGVGLMLSISSRVKNFPGLLAIAEKYENVFCTVGTHPHNAHEELDITTADLVKRALPPHQHHTPKWAVAAVLIQTASRLRRRLEDADLLIIGKPVDPLKQRLTRQSTSRLRQPGDMIRTHRFCHGRI